MSPHPPDPANPKAGDARTARSAPWSLLLLVMAMSGIGPMALNIVLPAMPGLVETFATDMETIQLIISTYVLGLAASQLLLGPLSDRFGRRPVLLAGLTLTALSSTGAIMASSAEGIIAARILQSLGASTGLVIGRAIVRDLFDRDRAASMFGLVTTVMAVAPMVAPLIGGILDTAFGWEATFLFIAVVSVVVLIWAVIALPETRPARAEGEKGQFFADVRMLSRSASFIGYVLVASFATATFFTYLAGAPHVVVTQMGRTSAEYGLWFLLPSFGYITGNFFASRFSTRYGVVRMIWVGLAIEVTGTLIGLYFANFHPAFGPAIIFLPQYVISCGNGLIMPNSIAGAVSVNPRAAGTASGVTGFTQMAISALAAQIVGSALLGATSAVPMMALIFAWACATAFAVGALVRRG